MNYKFKFAVYIAGIATGFVCGIVISSYVVLVLYSTPYQTQSYACGFQASQMYPYLDKETGLCKAFRTNAIMFGFNPWAK